MLRGRHLPTLTTAAFAALLAVGCSADGGPAPAAPIQRAPPTVSAPAEPSATAPLDAAPTSAGSAHPSLPPTSGGGGIAIGGGGRGVGCIGLSNDAGPAPCTDATFCHRLSLADLDLAVASVASKTPPTSEEILKHYHFATQGFFTAPDTNRLAACFRGEPPDRPLRATVRVELSGTWGECPGEGVRIVKTTASKATTDCVRDTLKRVVLPTDGEGRARLGLDVTLSSLEPSD